jgi:hypothetical protein
MTASVHILLNVLLTVIYSTLYSARPSRYYCQRRQISHIYIYIYIYIYIKAKLAKLRYTGPIITPSVSEKQSLYCKILLAKCSCFLCVLHAPSISSWLHSHWRNQSKYRPTNYEASHYVFFFLFLASIVISKSNYIGECELGLMLWPEFPDKTGPTP